MPPHEHLGARYDGPPAGRGRSVANVVAAEWLGPIEELRRFAPPSAASSFNPETREFEAVAATSTPVRRRDAKGEFWEVLDMGTLDRTRLDDARVLDNHRNGSVRDVIGAVIGDRIEGDQLIITGRLSQGDDVTPIAQRMADGTQRAVSIGYSVAGWRERTDAQGRRMKSPTKWAIREISLVVDGADPRARVRKKRSSAMEDDVTEAAPPGEVERTRRKTIRTLVRAAGLPAEAADDLIDSGADETTAKAAVYDAQQARRRSAPIIRTHAPANDDPAVIRRRQTDALVYRMGGGELPDDARPYADMRLLDMMRGSVERMGVSTRAMSNDELLLREAGMHTTSDFALAVSNAVNKTALDSYRAAASPLKMFCRQTTLSDFKDSTAIRLGEMGRLEEMAETGEFTATTRAEAGESMRLKTYGRRIDLSRNLIINDDLNLLGGTARAFGEAAAQTEADVLVGPIVDNPNLSDGTAVFHASRDNIGTAGAPSVAALTAGRETMRTRTGLDGETIINVQPRYLLVPADLETEAEQLLATLAPSTVGEVNPFAGSLRLLVEPRLPSGTWYLFTDPARLATMRYAYLGSAQGVQIQRREAWDVLGLSFGALLDFGAGWLDWRGAHRMPAA